MLANEKISRVKLSQPLSVPSENMLIAAIIISFLILHVLAGTILQQAPVAGATMSQPQEAGPSLYD
ncbi:hypothetical protein [Bradyrhizobium canariense]|uniref:Uncharacterized protein n=1 Tax=Bradyrhizobium canariense TaxID=255045 RepID=A0A1H1UCZ5_9BRAD|nr:hypothetical protein [Bradyrhizobium canariense]SDS70308.1 hypothetical protein SAMN05444158_2908 [Bradyrhizobium canariense]